MHNSQSSNIFIILPNNISVRNIVETPVIDLLIQQKQINFTLVTSSEGDRDKLISISQKNIQWKNINAPISPGKIRKPNLGRQIKQFLYNILISRIKSKADFGNLVFRFNNLYQFKSHMNKMGLPPEYKEREAIAGNFVDSKFGNPFPKSWHVFRFLYWIYYSSWQYNTAVESYFDLCNPKLVILSNIQSPQIKFYWIAAHRRKIPILSIIGSWDKLTTKGPLCPDSNCYIANSKKMRLELQEIHNVPTEKIELTGWPQMDFYKKEGIIKKKNDFYHSLQIPDDRKLIVFALNGERLGSHEPGIAKHLADKIHNDEYAKSCTLYIRPHPKDNRWKERVGDLHSPPKVIVQKAEWGRLDHLTNLLHHSDVLIASQGSISLDAIAMNTCVVNIAFDGDLDIQPYKSIKRTYEMDHYMDVIQNNGTTLVESYDELDRAIRSYLDNPNLYMDGRKKIFDWNLEPFDGQASKRLVETIIKTAGL